MKKNTRNAPEMPRRLTLHRETVQNLQPELLDLVYGGITTSGPVLTMDNS